MPAVGAVLSLLIVIDSVSVQPFAAVTVTVYVPSVVTEVDAVLSPVDHAYVPPPVAVSAIEGVVQLTTVVAGVLMPAVGAIGWVLIVIVVAEDVQLLALVVVNE